MLSLSFTQATTEGSRSAVRNTVEASFRLFGSYLALILRFVGMILSRFQRFSIDNSMVKKLYTADNPDDKGDGKGRKKWSEGMGRMVETKCKFQQDLGQAIKR